jgi:hypothetical protein
VVKQHNQRLSKQRQAVYRNPHSHLQRKFLKCLVFLFLEGLVYLFLAGHASQAAHKYLAAVHVVEEGLIEDVVALIKGAIV